VGDIILKALAILTKLKGMKFLSFIPFFVHPLLFISQISAAEWYAHEFDVMGTRASIELWSNSEADAQGSFSAVEDEMRRIELVMSSYIEDSELSAVNRLSAHQSFILTPELYQLIQKSLYFSRKSYGAFDITYASVGASL
jgi:thiamine biosynthesis lipoprotein